jgi:hypothetical protein
MARAIDANRMKEELLWGNVFLSAKEINALVDLIDNQPTLTPPNEPLTLDELREMDGEPAYIPETNCWVLVTKNPFVPLFTWPDGEQCSAYDWYEQVGPVYRRPPEGEDGDANHA